MDIREDGTHVSMIREPDVNDESDPDDSAKNVTLMDGKQIDK